MYQLPRTSPARALALALVLPLAACASLTEPGNGAPPPAPEEPTAPAAVAEVVEQAPAAPAPAPEPQIGTSHLLVQYKGAERAPASITRTKEEAQKRAEAAVAKIKKGQDFAAAVGEFSDEPGAKARGGALPKFGRSSAFDERFKAGAFKLKPGEVSPVVESDFGFHVIKRTE